MKTSRHWLCAIAFAATSQLASAQVITSEEIERGLRIPNSTPYDGAPYTARYSYGLNMPFVYINQNSNFLWNIYWQDRIDRAAKFGYPMPRPYEMGPPPPAYPRVRNFFSSGRFTVLRW